MPRFRRKHVDYAFLITTGLLLVPGLFILASASFGISELKFDTPYFYFSRQLIGVGIGLAALFIGTNIKYSFWKKLSPFLLLLGIVLFILLFVPAFGRSHNTGAVRWLDISFFSFQPAEFVKVAFIIYLAAWLDSRKKEVLSFSQGFLPFLFMTGFIGIFLILQPDLSTFVILVASSFILFFLGGGRSAQIIIAVLLGIILLTGYIYITQYNYERLLVFFHPESDPQNTGYQIKQALIAIGSGGLTGKGFGLSQQKYSRLPEPVGDSIFAVFSEEFGFIGNFLLLLLFFIFLWRGMLIAIRAPDRFGYLLAAGITTLILVQVIVNIGAFTGLLPVTGTPLPFISYGRSAMIALLGSVGILLNISRYSTRKS